MFKALIAGATLASGMKCPGSPAILHHASCETTTTFRNMGCAGVADEIKQRINGNKGWVDPHNGGKYHLLEESQDGTTLSVSRVTGNGKYTDKQIFTLDHSGANCVLSSCSESQVFSILDFGTNFCDIHNLYCGSQDNCQHVVHDLQYDESVGSCTKADKKACIVKKDVAEVEGEMHV